MKSKSKSLDLIIKILAALLVITIILKLFVIEFYKISGQSMTPAIKSGSTIAVSKISYGLVLPFSDKLLFNWSGPKKGDVVFYMYNDRMVIKRCAATAGDTLEYSYNSGYNLKVNGKTVSLTKNQYENLKNTTSVPENTILALGDNSEFSIDSRNYGFVPVNNILGRVLCR
ncbi:signal peptidase I [Treponema sp.]|uniref:signal peptidase I n=1 Tax=Treponema sp. TaxID=166 RepID=UPI0025EE923D|nr:signal peptidase I [Treponema sp.]MCR5218257.1 signal peptidase I [Treponema sp.]